MEPGRWDDVEAVFQRVLERAPEERIAAVAELAGGDEELRSEVMSLLEGYERGESLEHPEAWLPADEIEPLVGRRIGPYEIQGRLGEGGMGTVFDAVRADDQFHRRVALKLVRAGLGDRSLVRRFQSERRILASLVHPRIAALFDGGVMGDGRPWFAMEYVEGEPLDSYCDAGKVSLEPRLELFLQVCDAVQFAHRNLVVHRDLKPGNILVTADGEVKLLDFGIAKLLDEGSGSAALPTLTQGAHAFTPEYASPEQLEGARVTTASDVYSLGVVLYELLTGQRPFPTRVRSAIEIARSLEVGPKRPSSTATEEAARVRGEDRAARLRKRLAGDLDAIVLMALRREPEHRYGTVAEMAEDIRRFLDRRPVLARRGTTGYRVRKFVRRHRAAVTAAAAVVFVLAAGVAATSWQARVAETERAKAEAVNAFLRGMLASANPTWNSPGAKAGPSVTVAEVLDAAAARVDSVFVDQPEVEAATRMTLGLAYAGLGLYDAAEREYRAALPLHRRLYGPSHLEFGRNLYLIGQASYFRGDYERAEAAYRQAIPLFEGSGASVDSLRIGALNDLALLHWQRGRPEQAEPLFLRALEEIQRRYGADNPMAAIAHNNLGLVHEARGDLPGAETHYRQAVDTYAGIPGRELPDRGASLANLGRILTRRGEYAAARPVQLEALATFERTVGPDHPYTARAWSTLAYLDYSRGDFSQALAEIERALAILRPTLPTDHLEITTVETTHGVILTALGRPREAERRLRAALAARRSALPPGDYRIAVTTYALGAALAAQGRDAEAEPLVVATYPVLQATRGPSDRLTIEAGRLLEDLRSKRPRVQPTRGAGRPSAS